MFAFLTKWIKPFPLGRPDQLWKVTILPNQRRLRKRLRHGCGPMAHVRLFSKPMPNCASNPSFKTYQWEHFSMLCVERGELLLIFRSRNTRNSGFVGYECDFWNL